MQETLKDEIWKIELENDLTNNYFSEIEQFLKEV